METTTNITIRVYGIIFIEKNKILISDEIVHGDYITKFPGGGLQYGEGTIEALKREAIEECNQTIEVIEHFYTTDFFQPAFYLPNTQVLSIYYLARFTEKPQFKISHKKFDFEKKEDFEISFRLLDLEKADTSEFSLPIDKYVFDLLKQNLSKIKSNVF